MPTTSRAELRYQARAAAARKLIATGTLNPLDALHYVITPTTRILSAERKVSTVALKDRVYRDSRR